MVRSERRQSKQVQRRRLPGRLPKCPARVQTAQSQERSNCWIATTRTKLANVACETSFGSVPKGSTSSVSRRERGRQHTNPRWRARVLRALAGISVTEGHVTKKTAKRQRR